MSAFLNKKMSYSIWVRNNSWQTISVNDRTGGCCTNFFFCQPAKLILVNSWSIPWELKGRTHGLWIDLSPLDISRCNTLTDFTESVSKMALFCLWMNNSQISILISYYLSGSTTPPQLWGFLAKCGSFDNQTTTPDQVFILHNINVKLYESIFN